MDYGIKISPETVSVIDADDTDIAYSSKFSGWKILQQGQFTINATSKFTEYKTTITGLPTGGVALAWIENNSGNGRRWFMPHSDGATSWSSMRIKSDSLELTITVSTLGSLGVYNRYYYWMARS